MILFYIDESGTGLKDRRTPYFVLATIGFPTDVWAEEGTTFILQPSAAFINVE